ncbi:hydroxyacid dehydrogenase (plasmid) [Rhizobium sp. SYY.PMSO]
MGNDALEWLTDDDNPEKYVVGITDHMIGRPDLEAKVLGNDVEIDFFATTDEDLFDADRLARLDALMVWGARLTSQSISRLRRCRGVVRYDVRYEKIDLAALANAGIPFANNPDYGTEEVADHAIAMILSLHGAFGNTVRAPAIISPAGRSIA